MIIMNLKNDSVIDYNGIFTQELLSLGYLPMDTILSDYEYDQLPIDFKESTKERNNSKFAVIYSNSNIDACVRYYPRLVDVVCGLVSEKYKKYKYKTLFDFTVDDNKIYALNKGVGNG